MVGPRRATIAPSMRSEFGQNASNQISQASGLSMKNSGFFGGVAKPMTSSTHEAFEDQRRTQNKLLTTAMMDTSMRNQNTKSSFSASSFFESNLKNMGFAKAQPRSSVVMNAEAGPTVEGKIDIKPKEGHLDMIFYDQEFEHFRDLPHYHGNEFKQELMKNAKLLATPGKGILAADESTGTIGKRFDQISVENTHENRKAYRELLFTTPNLEKHIAGVIMYDETARDSTSDGKRFVEVLAEKGILTGIKVDTGMTIIPGTNDESVTQGLDGLGARCKEYYQMGCRFAKWRAVIKIGQDCPSEVAIQETAHSLARYGNICQHNGLIPIIEPEIITDGDHDIRKCAEISEQVLNTVMNQLIKQGLLLEGLLFKPNMVTPGADCEKRASPEEVAFYTVRTLSRTITPAVPGITFLSGGQSEAEASANLNAINKLAEIKHPWNISFSFGRALQ